MERVSQGAAEIEWKPGRSTGEGAQCALDRRAVLKRGRGQVGDVAKLVTNFRHQVCLADGRLGVKV